VYLRLLVWVVKEHLAKRKLTNTNDLSVGWGPRIRTLGQSKKPPQSRKRGGKKREGGGTLKGKTVGKSLVRVQGEERRLLCLRPIVISVATKMFSFKKISGHSGKKEKQKNTHRGA